MLTYAAASFVIRADNGAVAGRECDACIRSVQQTAREPSHEEKSRGAVLLHDAVTLPSGNLIDW